MASLTLLVCCLLVASTYSQPGWFGANNIFGPGFGGGYPIPGGNGGNGGGYPVPGGRPGTGGNSGGRPGTGGNSGGRPGTVGNGGYPGGRPDTGGNGGYPGGRPNNGGSGGYPGGRPNNGGSGEHNGGYPSSGGGGGYPNTGSGGGSTNTGGSECKCKIPDFKCIDRKTDGSNAKCPSGYTATSCSCANGCGTSIFPAHDSCQCQCYEVDWTLARCCRNE